MTREDIIRMAREAGFKASIGKTDKDDKYHPDVNAIGRDVPVEWLERFAALVAAAEREIQAEAFEQILTATRNETRAAEREACAKVCDSHAFAEGVPGAPTWSEACAAAIRARGQA